jgi:dGTPase
MIHDIVKNSEGKPDILMSADVEKAMADLRKFMFANVYTNPKAKAEEQKAQDMLEHLFSFYKEHPEKMSEEFVDMLENRGESLEDVVCDYISGMTDQYAIQKFQEYFVPKSWS